MGLGDNQLAAATDVAQPASAGPDASPRPVFQPFCAEQRVPGLSGDARASWLADSSSPRHPPNGGAVGEGPDGRVPGPNGPRSWARTTRGEGGPLGPSGTGLGGPNGPPQMPTRGNNVSSCGHLARPRRRPRCATRGQATNRDCPPPPSAENEVRLDPNGAQVPELQAALDIGHRRACRKTPQTVQSILELVRAG